MHIVYCLIEFYFILGKNSRKSVFKSQFGRIFSPMKSNLFRRVKCMINNIPMSLYNCRPMRTHVSLSNWLLPNAGFQFIKLTQLKLEMIFILKVFLAALFFSLPKINKRVRGESYLLKQHWKFT